MIDRDGELAEIREFVVHGDRNAAVIELATGARLTISADLLHLLPDGGYSIEGKWSQLASESPTRVEIPLVQERVSVGVRAKQERFRIRRRVATDHHELHTPVWTERLEIERVDRDAFVDRAPEPRHEGDTLVIPIVEEVPVVNTRLRLREEVRIRVVRERRVEHTTVPLRRHELEIEREPSAEPAAESPNPPAEGEKR